MDLDGLSQPHRRLMLVLLQHGPLRRRELARRMGLSGGSITRLTRPLEEKGLVVATSTRVNRKGRPVHVLDAALPADTVLGVSLTATAVRVVRTDLRARTTADVAGTLPVAPAAPGEPTVPPEAVVARVQELVASLPPGGHDVGVGVGASGTVRGGTLVRSPFLRWHNVALASLVEQALGLPCSLANDVAAAALAEAWFGVGKTADSFLALTLGTGVGGAAVVRGVVQDAEAHGVGLLSRLPVVWPDGSVRRAGTSLSDAGLVSLARWYGSGATGADEV
ncbi:MAG: ROK family transcriptional regulator, partial [Actinomycetia bacterium]|nr:ROK family transcriptional regulator [Actinomycetes bacterium]